MSSIENEAAMREAFFSRVSADTSCDMCGKPGVSMMGNPDFNSCEEHAHIPPVFRMDVSESAG